MGGGPLSSHRKASAAHPFSLRGTRYPLGTVTIFDGDDKEVDAGEIIDVKEVTSSTTGAFTSKELTAARGTPGDLSYEVWTKDSRGDVQKVVFNITEPTVTYEPLYSAVGSALKITISDWQRGTHRVGAVKIGGKTGSYREDSKVPESELLRIHRPL